MPFIISENIEQECVNLLSLYKDTQYVQKLLIKNYPNLSDNKQKSVARKIKSLVVQGLHFLEKTDENILTAPLTLYYSIYNFSKAIFLINNPNLSIANTHGLKFNNLIADSAKEIGEIQTGIETKGAFVNLLTVTGDTLNNKDILVAKDIFSNIPELSAIYSLRYLCESNTILLQPFSDGHYELMLQIKDPSSFEQDKLSLPISNGMLFQRNPNQNMLGIVAYRSAACTNKNLNECTCSDIYGNLYLVCGMNINGRKQKLSKMTSLYLIYYMFGMLSRYYPEKWMDFCDNADSTIIRQIVVNSKRDMLVETLQLLSKEEYHFETKLQSKPVESDISDLWDKLKKEIRKDMLRSGHKNFESLM